MIIYNCTEVFHVLSTVWVLKGLSSLAALLWSYFSRKVICTTAVRTLCVAKGRGFYCFKQFYVDLPID